MLISIGFSVHWQLRSWELCGVLGMAIPGRLHFGKRTHMTRYDNCTKGRRPMNCAATKSKDIEGHKDFRDSKDGGL